MNLTTRRLPTFLSLLAGTALFLLGTRGQAQTYFYLDQIVVAPATPTTGDDITLTLSGSLSSTAAYIVNTAFILNGSTVEVTVNAAVDGIGLDVLVPHSESIPIGNLAEGAYTILINGSAIADLAPSAEHLFVVAGGAPTDCDSLELISARWGVFSDGSILLTVANASSDLFDYPGFVLLSEEGDTLAQETVNYFGIGQAPQEHLLEVPPGTVFDGSTISGELHLWSGFFSEQECTWPVTWDLCQTQECFTVQPYLWNLGDAIVTASCPYTLENEDGVELSAGTFNLNLNVQNAYGTEVCLPPGNYTLHLDQMGFVGGQLFYGMSAPPMNTEQVQEPYEQGTAENTLAFPVLENCIDGSNGIPSGGHRPGLAILMEGDRIRITSEDGAPIGRYQVLDAQGRSVLQGTLNAAQGQLAIGSPAHGVYVLRTEGHAPVRFTL